MKIAIECRSPLLQKSLEHFLEGHLVSERHCDYLISDEKLPGRSNLIRIGNDSEADIIKPFSKSQLFLKLETLYKRDQALEESVALSSAMDEEMIDMPESYPTPEIKDNTLLEEKIERLTRQYVRGLMSLIEDHYEKN